MTPATRNAAVVIGLALVAGVGGCSSDRGGDGAGDHAPEPAAVVAPGTGADARAATVDTTPAAGAGVLEAYVHDFMDDIAQINAAYLAELQAIGWDDVLDPGRLRVDANLAGMADSRRLVAEAKERVAKYYDLTKSRVNEFHAGIDTLPLPPGDRAEMRRSFAAGIAGSGDRLARNWVLERQILDEVGGIIEVLADHPQWVIEDDQIHFDDDEAITRFDAHLASMQAAMSEQARLREENLAQARRLAGAP